MSGTPRAASAGDGASHPAAPLTGAGGVSSLVSPTPSHLPPPLLPPVLSPYNGGLPRDSPPHRGLSGSAAPPQLADSPVGSSTYPPPLWTPPPPPPPPPAAAVDGVGRVGASEAPGAPTHSSPLYSAAAPAAAAGPCLPSSAMSGPAAAAGPGAAPAQRVAFTGWERSPVLSRGRNGAGCGPSDGEGSDSSATDPDADRADRRRGVGSSCCLAPLRCACAGCRGCGDCPSDDGEPAQPTWCRRVLRPVLLSSAFATPAWLLLVLMGVLTAIFFFLPWSDNPVHIAFIVGSAVTGVVCGWAYYACGEALARARAREQRRQWRVFYLHATGGARRLSRGIRGEPHPPQHSRSHAGGGAGTAGNHLPLETGSAAERHGSVGGFIPPPPPVMPAASDGRGGGGEDGADGGTTAVRFVSPLDRAGRRRRRWRPSRYRSDGVGDVADGMDMDDVTVPEALRHGCCWNGCIRKEYYREAVPVVELLLLGLLVLLSPQVIGELTKPTTGAAGGSGNASMGAVVGVGRALEQFAAADRAYGLSPPQQQQSLGSPRAAPAAVLETDAGVAMVSQRLSGARALSDAARSNQPPQAGGQDVDSADPVALVRDGLAPGTVARVAMRPGPGGGIIDTDNGAAKNRYGVVTYPMSIAFKVAILHAWALFALDISLLSDFAVGLVHMAALMGHFHYVSPATLLLVVVWLAVPIILCSARCFPCGAPPRDATARAAGRDILRYSLPRRGRTGKSNVVVDKDRYLSSHEYEPHPESGGGDGPPPRSSPAPRQHRGYVSLDGVDPAYGGGEGGSREKTFHVSASDGRGRCELTPSRPIAAAHAPDPLGYSPPSTRATSVREGRRGLRSARGGAFTADHTPCPPDGYGSAKMDLHRARPPLFPTPTTSLALVDMGDSLWGGAAGDPYSFPHPIDMAAASPRDAHGVGGARVCGGLGVGSPGGGSAIFSVSPRGRLGPHVASAPRQPTPITPDATLLSPVLAPVGEERVRVVVEHEARVGLGRRAGNHLAGAGPRGADHDPASADTSRDVDEPREGRASRRGPRARSVPAPSRAPIVTDAVVNHNGRIHGTPTHTPNTTATRIDDVCAPFLVLSVSLVILDATPAMAALLGTTADNLRYRRLPDILQWLNVADAECVLRTLRDVVVAAARVAGGRRAGKGSRATAASEDGGGRDGTPPVSALVRRVVVRGHWPVYEEQQVWPRGGRGAIPAETAAMAEGAYTVRPPFALSLDAWVERAATERALVVLRRPPLHGACDELPVPLALLHPTTGRVLYWSRYAEEVTGRSAYDAVGSAVLAQVLLPELAPHAAAAGFAMSPDGLPVSSSSGGEVAASGAGAEECAPQRVMGGGGGGGGGVMAGKGSHRGPLSVRAVVAVLPSGRPAGAGLRTPGEGGPPRPHTSSDGGGAYTGSSETISGPTQAFATLYQSTLRPLCGVFAVDESGALSGAMALPPPPAPTAAAVVDSAPYHMAQSSQCSSEGGEAAGAVLRGAPGVPPSGPGLSTDAGWLEEQLQHASLLYRGSLVHYDTVTAAMAASDHESPLCDLATLKFGTVPIVLLLERSLSPSTAAALSCAVPSSGRSSPLFPSPLAAVAAGGLGGAEGGPPVPSLWGPGSAAFHYVAAVRDAVQRYKVDVDSQPRSVAELNSAATAAAAAAGGGDGGSLSRDAAVQLQRLRKFADAVLQVTAHYERQGRLPAGPGWPTSYPTSPSGVGGGAGRGAYALGRNGGGLVPPSEVSEDEDLVGPTRSPADESADDGETGGGRTRRHRRRGVGGGVLPSAEEGPTTPSQGSLGATVTSLQLPQTAAQQQQQQQQSMTVKLPVPLRDGPPRRISPPSLAADTQIYRDPNARLPPALTVVLAAGARETTSPLTPAPPRPGASSSSPSSPPGSLAGHPHVTLPSAGASASHSAPGAALHGDSSLSFSAPPAAAAAHVSAGPADDVVAGSRGQTPTRGGLRGGEPCAGLAAAEFQEGGPAWSGSLDSPAVETAVPDRCTGARLLSPSLAAPDDGAGGGVEELSVVLPLPMGEGAVGLPVENARYAASAPTVHRLDSASPLLHEQVAASPLSRSLAALSGASRAGGGASSGRSGPVWAMLYSRDEATIASCSVGAPPGEVFSFGRSSKCTASTEDKFVSSVHFSISRRAVRRRAVDTSDSGGGGGERREKVYVYSLHDHSANGTYVNVKKIGKGKSCVLHDNALITFRLSTLQFFLGFVFMLPESGRHPWRRASPPGGPPGLYPSTSARQLIERPQTPSQSATSLALPGAAVAQARGRGTPRPQASSTPDNASLASGYSTPVQATSGQPSRRAGPPGVRGGRTASGSRRPRPETIEWKIGEEMLGKGGNAEVYLGINLTNGQLIAVKRVRLPPTLQGESVAHDDLQARALVQQYQSLHKEINFLSKAVHPNIVQYYGSSQNEHYFNILLEFVPGGSLRHLLDNFGAFSPVVVFSYLRQVLQGLCYLHDNKIVHSDIKTANILITEKGEAKLTDFGTAKLLSKPHTNAPGGAGGGGDGARSGSIGAGGAAGGDGQQTFHLAGTLRWMDPALFRSPDDPITGEPSRAAGDGGQGGATRASDVWSVGCALIEMMSGDAPWFEYEFESEEQIVNLLRYTDEPPMVPEYPACPELVAIAEMCLRFRPSERPTARELLQAVEAAESRYRQSSAAEGPPSVSPSRELSPSPLAVASLPAVGAPSAPGGSGSVSGAVAVSGSREANAHAGEARPPSLRGSPPGPVGAGAPELPSTPLAPASGVGAVVLPPAVVSHRGGNSKAVGVTVSAGSTSHVHSPSHHVLEGGGGVAQPYWSPNTSGALVPSPGTPPGAQRTSTIVHPSP